MSFRGPDPPPPLEPVGAGESTIEYLFGDADWAQGLGVASPEVQEAILEAERTYGPEYVANTLGNIQTALPGLIDLSRTATEEFGGIEADALRRRREADIADVGLLGQRATQAFRESDPQRQALLDRQQRLTDDLYSRAARPTPQQERQARQTAREGYAARGRELDNASIFAEALGREDIMRQNRAEAQNAGAGLFGMLQATSADPFQAILGRPAQSLPYGASAGAQALGMGGNVGPSLFNPDAGVNLALQNNANQANYNASTYGAQAGARGQAMGGLFSGIGALGGGLFGSGLFGG